MKKTVTVRDGFKLGIAAWFGHVGYLLASIMFRVLIGISLLGLGGLLLFAAWFLDKLA